MGELIPTDTQLPAHLQAANQSVDNNALITTGGPTFPMISLRGRQFRLKKDGDEKVLSGITELKIVLLAAAPNSQLNAKTYYEGEYTTGSDEAPDCSSADGVKPDGNATNPQATACATCPKNSWGSAVSKMTGKDSKACKDTKMIYFVAPDKLDGDIVALRVPTMSLRHLSKFARALSSRKIPVSACVTAIKFVDSEYPEVEFGFGGYLDEVAYAKVTDRIASDEVVSILEGNSYASEVAAAEESSIPAVPSHLAEESTPTVVELEVETTSSDMFSTPEPELKPNMQDELAALQAQIAKLKGGEIKIPQTTGVDQTTQTTGVDQTPTDNTGRKWDARIDSSSKKIGGKGVWNRRKNVADALYNQVVAELTGGASTSTITEPTTTTAPSKSMFDMSAKDDPVVEASSGADAGSDLDALLDDWG